MAFTNSTRQPTTPGDILLNEFLEPLHLKIADLAVMLNVHRNSVSALVNNNRKLTTDMAVRLARAFDTTIEFWLNLQLNVDIWEIGRSSPPQRCWRREKRHRLWLKLRRHLFSPTIQVGFFMPE